MANGISAITPDGRPCVVYPSHVWIPRFGNLGSCIIHTRHLYRAEWYGWFQQERLRCLAQL